MSTWDWWDKGRQINVLVNKNCFTEASLTSMTCSVVSELI